MKIFLPVSPIYHFPQPSTPSWVTTFIVPYLSTKSFYMNISIHLPIFFVLSTFFYTKGSILCTLLYILLFYLKRYPERLYLSILKELLHPWLASAHFIVEVLYLTSCPQTDVCIVSNILQLLQTILQRRTFLQYTSRYICRVIPPKQEIWVTGYINL